MTKRQPLVKTSVQLPKAILDWLDRQPMSRSEAIRVFIDRSRWLGEYREDEIEAFCEKNMVALSEALRFFDPSGWKSACIAMPVLVKAIDPEVGEALRNTTTEQRIFILDYVCRAREKGADSSADDCHL